MATCPKFARLAHYSCECVEASHIFLKNGLWQMSASLASLCNTAWQMSRVWQIRATWLGECRRVWRVRAARLGKCWQVWQVLAKPLDECWPKKDRSIYAQITYFICIKWSSLNLLNLPNSPSLQNLPKTGQTCLSRVWQSAQHGLANVCDSGESVQHGLANVGKSGESVQHGLANAGKSGQSDTFPKKAILASTRIRQKWQISGEYLNSLNSLASGHSLVNPQHPQHIDF
jgi:hypothetical protein